MQSDKRLMERNETVFNLSTSIMEVGVKKQHNDTVLQWEHAEQPFWRLKHSFKYIYYQDFKV